MTATEAASRTGAPEAFRHEALLYAGDDDFVGATLPFVRDGLAHDEPVLVAVPRARTRLLQSALAGDADEVRFADMEAIGRNPSRIIPVWREFVRDGCTGGRRARGIGEPIWAARAPAELVECQHHETLLNLAFVDDPALWLVCPYDVTSLPADVIAEAECSHPFVAAGGRHRASPDYRGLAAAAGTLAAPLEEPSVAPDELGFGRWQLDRVRRFVARHAAVAGLDRARTGDLVVAVNEVATNSLRHAGGGGTIRAWRDGDALVCEVRDGGRIGSALVGREVPPRDSEGGRGLWIVNQLCDLVQVRSTSTGTVVRLHVGPR